MLGKELGSFRAGGRAAGRRLRVLLLAAVLAAATALLAAGSASADVWPHVPPDSGVVALG